MTNLTDAAECSKCGALLQDTDDSIAKHRRWHAQLDDAHEAVRRVASNASKDVTTLTATVKDYQRPVATPAPAAPVTIRVTDPDELEPDDSDHIIDVNATTDPDDIITVTPTFIADEYPLAIDRDDDLDARIHAATGTQPTI